MSHRRTRRTVKATLAFIALDILAGTFLMAGLYLGAQVTPPGSPATAMAGTLPCASAKANNYCAPDSSRQTRSIVAKAKRNGYVCSPEAALTDTIVFQYKDTHTEMVTFDEATVLARTESGWIKSFCTKTT